MSNQMKVAVIGGLGLMASPMAKHWKPDGPVKVVRVHDRGTRSERHDRCRDAWKNHGAELVSTLEVLVGSDTLDAIFICCGKNGDDAPIIGEVTELLSKRGSTNTIVCHMSTVSSSFATVAESYCRSLGIEYVNYPLTGGPRGAETAKMLILASGSEEVFERLRPGLTHLGNPKHFGENISAGAEVKLIGHLMVFNGLMGISSAAAVHAECFNNGKIGGTEQADFFDFLNAGAGGTRQWELIMSSGIRNDIWNEPFSISYAAIDAIYAAELCREKKVSRITVEALLNTVLAFSYVLNHVGLDLSTHAIVREMIRSRAAELDAFVLEHRAKTDDLGEGVQRCIASLPERFQRAVLLDIKKDDFSV